MKRLITCAYFFGVLLSGNAQIPDTLISGQSTREELREAINWNILTNAEQIDTIAQIRSQAESNSLSISANDSDIAANDAAITANDSDILSLVDSVTWLGDSVRDYDVRIDISHSMLADSLGWPNLTVPGTGTITTHNLVVNENAIVKPGDGFVDISVLLSRLRALEKDYYGVSSPDEALMLHYKFERNTNDESSYNMTGIASGGFKYSDLDSDGSKYAGEFTDNEFVTSPPLNHSSTFSVLIDVVIGNDSSGVLTLIGNMSGSDGWKLQLDQDTKKIQFVTGDGGSTDTVFSDAGVYAVDTIFPHVIFRVGITSSGTLYKNGEEITGTGSIQSGFETSDSVRIGSARGDTEFSYSYLDNPKIFSGVLDSADFNDEYLLNEYYKSTIDDFPILIGGEVSAGTPGQVYLYFSKLLYNYKSDSTFGAFIYAINDSIVTVDSSANDDGSFVLYVDSCEYGNNLKISYNANYYSGLEDFEGNKMASFTDFYINNNLDVPGSDTIPLADIQYLFENSGENNINSYTLIDTSTTYTTAWAAEGTYSKNSTGTNGKLYIPATYNSDALTDTFTVAFWYYCMTNTTNLELFGNDGYTSGEGMLIYLNATGDDLIVIGETGNSGNEVRSTNFTGAAPVLNEAHHFAITYKSGSGRCHIYIDGVLDMDADSLLDANISLSGNWRLIKNGGRIDDFQVYPRELSASQIDGIYANPGTVAYGAGSGGTTPPATDFESYAVPLFDMLDFEEYDVGNFSLTQMQNLLNPYATDVFVAGYYSGLSAYWPDIISYDYDSAGTRNSKGIKFYHPSGYSSTGFTNEARYQFPPNPNNIDVYLTFNVQFVPSVAWDNMTYNRPSDGQTDNWKHNGMIAATNGLNDPHISETSYNAASIKIVGKPRNAAGSYNRWSVYPKGGWSVLYDTPTLRDPDDQANSYYYHDPAENLHNITIRMCLSDIDDPTHGFFEFFIDGKFSYRYDSYNLQPFKIVDAGVYINGLILKYHQNWGPIGSSADLVYDDIVMFRYRMDFQNGEHWCKKSASTRKLLLPGWDTDGGYKITINE